VDIECVINTIDRWVWIPLIVLIMTTGIYFTIKLKILNVSILKLGAKYVFEKEGRSGDKLGDISSFAALCTVLSATLGTGNIVGIAVAVTIGGPGVIFWLWVSSLLCFSIKYAEGLLAIKYRTIGSDGKISGGPMYYIENGFKNRALAKAYSLFGVLVAVLGIGTLAQSNSIVKAVGSFGVPANIATMVISLVVIAVTIGGIQRIARISEMVVPAMTFFYISSAIIVLVMKIDMLPHAFYMIFQGAFSPESILGSGAGATVAGVLHLGISRGIYSHESGLGSAAIASAAAKIDLPAKQGIISMMGAFLTVIVCTMTGLVLIITHNDTALFSAAREIDGTLLTSCAFGIGLGIQEIGRHIVNLSIIFFAFTTIIGWNYYGEKCIQYLLNDKFIIPYKIVFVFFVAVGPFLKIDTIFVIADIVIGLMTVPNIIGIIGLKKEIFRETEDFCSHFVTPKKCGVR